MHDFQGINLTTPIKLIISMMPIKHHTVPKIIPSPGQEGCETPDNDLYGNWRGREFYVFLKFFDRDSKQ